MPGSRSDASPPDMDSDEASLPADVIAALVLADFLAEFLIASGLADPDDLAAQARSKARSGPDHPALEQARQTLDLFADILSHPSRKRLRRQATE